MGELKIVGLEELDITAWDFDSIKEELTSVLATYKTVVYTDETIKDAKNDKATLAKAKKLVEDQRKAYKAKCLAPYETIEPQVKELVSMLEEQRLAIDDVIKDYTDRQKWEKEKEVRAYYDKKAFVFGEYASPLFEKILDPKWLNASTSKAKYEEEIQVAIQNTLSDINEIRGMKSRFVESLMETYVSTLSLEEVRAKNDEWIKISEETGIVPTVPEVANEKPLVKDLQRDASAGIDIKIYANSTQMNQICDFMKAIGVTYEIQ